MNPLLSLVSVERLAKKIPLQGPLPSTKEIYQRTLRIAWPSALETVLVGLVSSIDTIMVGGLGPEAIAAVGITNQPKFILLALIMSLNVGVTTVVARRKGQMDMDGANRCLRQAVLLSGLLSLVLACLGYLFAEPIMVFAGAEPEIMTDAVNYFQIIMLGFVPMCMGLTINAAQRGVGNTRISMTTNLTANAVNLVFNYFLISGNLGFPRLEVRGAALATILGGFVSFLMSARSVFFRSNFLQLSFRESWKPDRRTLSSIWSISSSAVVEQLFMRIGFFTYARIVAGLGTIAFATHQVCMNIMNISFNFGDGFSIAISSLVGQSLGAKRPDLARIYVKATQVLMFSCSFLLAIGFLSGRYVLVELFTDDVRIIEMSRSIMYIIAATTLIQTAAMSYSGCLRGAGDAKYIAVMAFVSIGIVRPLCAWVMCYPLGLGLFGAWISFITDQTLRWAFTSHRFRKGRWALIQV